MTEALLLIDIQNDYFPGGAMECTGMEQASDVAFALLEEFRREKKPVIFVRHLSIRKDATFFLPGTRGSEIHDLVAPGPTEVVIEKHFPNSFYQTGLLGALRERGVTDCVICGAMSHMCIDATSRRRERRGSPAQSSKTPAPPGISSSGERPFPPDRSMQPLWRR